MTPPAEEVVNHSALSGEDDATPPRYDFAAYTTTGFETRGLLGGFGCPAETLYPVQGLALAPGAFAEAADRAAFRLLLEKNCGVRGQPKPKAGSSVQPAVDEDADLIAAAIVRGRRAFTDNFDNLVILHLLQKFNQN